MVVRLIALLIISLAFTNCSSDREGVPDCIDSSYFDNDRHSIKTQDFNGTTHYWLNTQVSEADGTEYILNESCDTVCSFNGLFYPDCWLAYDTNNWEEIWPN